MNYHPHQFAIEKEVFDRQTSRVAEVKRSAAIRLVDRIEVILRNFGDSLPWNRLHEIICSDPRKDICEIYAALRMEYHRLLSV